MKKESIKTKGIVRIYKIKDKLIKPSDSFEDLKKKAYFKSIKHNVICYVGLRCITALLSAHNDDYVDWEEIFINNVALGDTAGHTDASTALNGELYRKNISSCSYSLNKLYTTSWYLPGDCAGNYREEGVFINGDLTADSGYPFSLVDLTAAEGDKTADDGLLVEREITFD